MGTAAFLITQVKTADKHQANGYISWIKTSPFDEVMKSNIPLHSLRLNKASWRVLKACCISGKHMNVGVFMWKKMEYIKKKPKYGQHCTLLGRLICKLLERLFLNCWAITGQHPTVWGRGGTECWNSKKPLRRRAAMWMWEHSDRLILSIRPGLRL